MKISVNQVHRFPLREIKKKILGQFWAVTKTYDYYCYITILVFACFMLPRDYFIKPLFSILHIMNCNKE